MKKIILIYILILTCSTGTFAQGSVPNGNFENWSSFATGTLPTYPYDLPDLWRTTDSLTLANSAGASHSAWKETGSVYSGSSALHLQSWSFYVGPTPFFNGLPGCATNGDVVVIATLSTQSISPIGGSADTVRHAQLSGFYQYTAGGGGGSDSGSIEVCLFKRNTITGNRDTVASGITYFHDQASYTQFNITISQYGTTALTPDSMLIWIQSSQRVPIGSGQTGSSLVVDSLSFSGVIGINEIPTIVNSITVFPVPAQNELNVHLDLKKDIHTSFEIMDATGRKIMSHAMNSLKEQINISALSSGNYFYQLLDDQRNKLSSGKFSVSK